MQCPACNGVLRAVKAKNFIVDVCPCCRGVWFDADEFAPFARQLSEREDLKPPPATFQAKSVIDANKVNEDLRNCPKCLSVMRKFNYAYDSNIILDKCTNCGGIWTDCGEIKNVAAYLKRNPKEEEFGKYLVSRNRDIEELAAIGESFGRRVPMAVMYMPKVIIPLGDELSRDRFPAITISLITLCTLVFVLVGVSGGLTESIVSEYGIAPASFLSIGLLTSMFLHGNIFHLLGNMYFLWIFGDNVEDRLGYIRYIMFYLGAELSANILHSLVNWGSPIPSIGASGAISGVMGAYLVFYPHARIKLFFFYKVIRVPAVGYLGFWFGFQLLFGLFYKGIGISNVAWFAHIGGFVFGAVFAYFVKKSEALKAGVFNGE